MTGDLTTVLGNDLGVFAFPPMVRRIAAAAQQHSQLSVLCGDGQEGGMGGRVGTVPEPLRLCWVSQSADAGGDIRPDNCPAGSNHRRLRRDAQSGKRLCISTKANTCVFDVWDHSDWLGAAGRRAGGGLGAEVLCVERGPLRVQRLSWRVGEAARRQVRLQLPALLRQPDAEGPRRHERVCNPKLGSSGVMLAVSGSGGRLSGSCTILGRQVGCSN
eukprot:138591-Rhodomonas_salina.2